MMDIVLSLPVPIYFIVCVLAGIGLANITIFTYMCFTGYSIVFIKDDKYKKHGIFRSEEIWD